MTTRRYARTMQEAFGPYTDNYLEPMRDTRARAWSPALTILVCTALTMLVAWNA